MRWKAKEAMKFSPTQTSGYQIGRYFPIAASGGELNPKRDKFFIHRFKRRIEKKEVKFGNSAPYTVPWPTNY